MVQFHIIQHFEISEYSKILIYNSLLNKWLIPFQSTIGLVSNNRLFRVNNNNMVMFVCVD